MTSPAARPTADELDRLIDQVRRDPASSAFVALGEMYLALGRPRDALDVGLAGLRATGEGPTASDGRVMVARAHAALHQWKEAQAELLKVVKVDRNHRDGFALLGEVLMRRGDTERALPVLQHAQNLDPSSPGVLALLRRARAGQPLDPPPPIPTPIEPVRGTSVRKPGTPSRPPPPVAARPPTNLDEGPTSVGASPFEIASARPSLDRGDPTELGGGPTFAETTGEITDEKTNLAPPHLGTKGGRAAAPSAPPPPDAVRKAARPSAPPPMGAMAAAAAAPRPTKASAPAAPPPASPAAAPAGVRPRVISAAKPPNPAAAALRQSAAAGENYLNDLLTGGLLDVPGVRVPDGEIDVKPDRRWGRSSGRMFIGLFVVLVLGAGGGVAYYLYSEQAKAEAIAKYRGEAAELKASGSYDDLDAAAKRLAMALDKDSKHTPTFADVAEVTALQAVLYGLPGLATDRAIDGAARAIKKDGQDGYDELVRARAAFALARLTEKPDAAPSLAAARGELETYLADHGDDRWARWLQGRMMLAAGERAAARTAFAAAADPAGDGDEGLLVAMIEQADLLVDDGKFDEAQALYARVLEREPDHPLALVGQVLARAERGADAVDDNTGTLAVLNVKLPEKKNLGARVRGYRQLAFAMAQYQTETYEAFDTALAQALADGPREPRYLGRVAMARLLAGDFETAVKARSSIAWFGQGTPEPDPIVNLFDAALLVESGLPARALDVLGNLQGTRAHLIRAQALLDLGVATGDARRLADALAEAELAEAGAESNPEANVLAALLRVVVAPAKSAKEVAAREELISKLDSLARGLVTKRGRHAQGYALFLIGNRADARLRLEQALEAIDQANPNPIKYRTQTLLARLDLAEGKLDAARGHIDEALKGNGGFLPAMVVQAQILLAGADPDGALASLQAVLAEPEAVTGEVELVHAEALIVRKGATADDRKAAEAAVRRAKDKGAPAADVGRVAALVSPDLPDQLGVPMPEGAPAADGDGDAKPAPKKSRRRRR